MVLELAKHSDLKLQVNDYFSKTLVSASEGQRLNKFLFLQLSMLTSFKRFHSLFSRSQFYDFETQKVLTALSDFSNDTYELMEVPDRILLNTYCEPNQIMRSFFQQRFFSVVSK